jgi:hypothetical protein
MGLEIEKVFSPCESLKVRVTTGVGPTRHGEDKEEESRTRPGECCERG